MNGVPVSLQNNPDPLSICIDCAKHVSLRRFIQRNGTTGAVCGTCGRKGVLASKPSEVTKLANLIRALIRLHYDEWDYNHHWGVDETPTSLLMKPNSILNVENWANSSYNEGDVEVFLNERIFWPPYPPVDKGISVYAGFHEGGQRGILRCLPTTPSPILQTIINRLQFENYFDIEPYLTEYMGKIDNHVTATLRGGTEAYRARIGFSDAFKEQTLSFTSPIYYQPYQGNEIGAPPPGLVAAGRANRHGISFLYLASDTNTAAAEIRPHPGHCLSLGTFRAKQDVRIADFSVDVDISDFSDSDETLARFHLIHSLNQAFSMPIVPEERGRYTVTKFVADALRHRGYAGIKFRSSVAMGTNLCMFYPKDFDWVPESGCVVQVNSMSYNITSLPSINFQSQNHYKLSKIT